MAKRLYRRQGQHLRHFRLGDRSGRGKVNFWFALDVNGLPYLSGSRRQGDQVGCTLFEYGPKPAFVDNRRRLLGQPNRNNESFLFTNWAGGKEYLAERPEEYSCDSQIASVPVGKCQPSSGMLGEGVAIYGHRNREETWFSVTTEA